MVRQWLLSAVGVTLWVTSFAQDHAPITKDQIKDRASGMQGLHWGYQTSVDGWVLKEGDTLSLGKGSLPNKDFAFLYENPGAFTATMTSDYRTIRKYLPSSYAGRRVILKELAVNGTKKIGFGVYGLVGVGNIVRYYLELDNAIDAGEILPPVQYRKNKSNESATSPSVADELLKLKQLLDAGALTQAEYDAQKKKLLNQ